MNIVTVEITSCDMPTAWYAELIGQRFEVYDNWRDYILKEDYDLGYKAAWRHITRDNCRVVSAPGGA